MSSSSSSYKEFSEDPGEDSDESEGDAPPTTVASTAFFSAYERPQEGGRHMGASPSLEPLEDEASTEGQHPRKAALARFRSASHFDASNTGTRHDQDVGIRAFRRNSSRFRGTSRSTASNSDTRRGRNAGTQAFSTNSFRFRGRDHLNVSDADTGLDRSTRIQALISRQDEIASNVLRVQKDVGLLVGTITQLAAMGQGASPSSCQHDLVQPSAEAPPTAPALVRKRVTKRRERAQVELAAKIRKYLDELLGDDIFSPELRVPHQEILGFDAIWNADPSNSPPCCDIENFRIDIMGSPRSAWNQSAAKIFSIEFVAKHELPFSDVFKVENAFYTRIKTLVADFRRISAGFAKVAEAARTQRHRGRKLGKYERRLEVAETHPLLVHHVPMLLRLGPGGMSSDESEADISPSHPLAARFITKQPLWRSEALFDFLHVMDSLHAIKRRKGETMRGSLPYARLVEAHAFSSNTAFVCGLPISAYRSAWLEMQRSADYTVRPTTENYVFELPPGLFSYF